MAKKDTAQTSVMSCLAQKVFGRRCMNLFSVQCGELSLKPREGDLIETLDGNVFDVKGLVHPPNRIIAFIRFTPDPEGERKRDNVRFRKVYPLHERYALLKERFPQYLVFDPVFNEWLCEVPLEAVREHYQPRRCLSQLRHKKSLDVLGVQTLELAMLLRKHARVRWTSLGVSGSLLVGLHTPSSDIDLIVYGSENGLRIHNALRSLVWDEASRLRPYTRQELKSLFDFRSKDTAVSLEDFIRTESRKLLQGKFHQRDYFIRCVKEWNEITEQYGSPRYRALGEAKIEATIADDSQTIFTPCIYPILNVKKLKGRTSKLPSEIVSFRGRFCEQARKGEKVIAQGKLERVQKSVEEEHFRLLLGNKPSDFLILA